MMIHRPDRKLSKTETESVQGKDRPTKDSPVRRAKDASSDRLEVSSDGMTLHRARLASDVPLSVRQEQVSRVRQALTEGRYQVDSEVVAMKILQEATEL